MIKIDEELDTITLNNFSSGFNCKDNSLRGARSSREQGRGGRNNTYIDRAGFNNNSQGGQNRNEVILGIRIRREIVIPLLRMISLQM